MSVERTAVVLDAQSLWLETVGRVLEQAGIRVVAAVTRPSEALAAVRAHAPDLVVLDAALADEGLDGQTLIRRVREERASARVIALAEEDDAAVIAAAFAAGAAAYVLKQAQAEDVLLAIKQIFKSTIYLPAPQAAPAVPVPSAESVDGDLTGREREVLSLVAAGQSNRQVARALWLRAYPGSGGAITVFQVMRAQARWSRARWFSGFFDQRMSSARKRLSQEWVRSTTQRRARKPASCLSAFASSPRQRMWAVKPNSRASWRTSS